MTMLTDELKSWIGREAIYSAPEELGRASIRYFALALGDDNPLYADDDYARAAGHRSVVAPPTLVCETCQYGAGPPGDNGYIGHEWDLPIDNVRLIRAGNDYEFTRLVYPDDRITVTWTLADIEERPARRDAAFRDLDRGVREPGRPAPGHQPRDHRLATARGEPAMKIPRPGDAMPPLERHVTTASIVAYGAATWDWHRMHYDDDYARAMGLPGVVLDGQAFGAYLAMAVTGWLGPGAFIRKLSFRMRSMVRPGDTIECVGEVTGVEEEDGADIVRLAQRLVVGDRVAAEATTEVRLTR